MQLSEIFNALTYGEFSQIHIGGASTEGIEPANHPHILSHINLGLTNLYTRFTLKEGRVTIDLVEGQNTYILDRKYASSNTTSTAPTKYLEDSYENPFLNDVLKVTQVLDDEGTELMLNAGDRPLDLKYVNIRTPVYNKIVVPDNLESQTLEVVYRARHPAVVIEDPETFDPEMVTLELPYTHMDALLYFIASRVFTPTGSSGEFHDGNNYAAKYERACQLLENQGMQVDTAEQVNRFQRGGWV